jgi:hypothetical protein
MTCWMREGEGRRHFREEYKEASGFRPGLVYCGVTVRSQMVIGLNTYIV